MAARSKRVRAPAAKPVTAPAPVRALKVFYHYGGVVDSFGFARFYWPGGDGDREPMGPRVTKKRRPSGAKATSDTAAGIEVLAPHDAPQAFADLDFMLSHYEASLPAEESIAFIQVTIRFVDCADLDQSYIRARGWFKSYYVEGHAVPVVLILHDPHLAGSKADGHVHALILPRRLGRGWMGRAGGLGGDGAAIKARLAWEAFRDGNKSSKTM